MHLNWQSLVIAQVSISALTILIARRLALEIKSVFYGVAVALYLTIAASGWLFGVLGRATIASPAHLPWQWLFIEGFCIPSAWLIQYKLIKHIGASNAVVVAILNTLFAAAMGIIFLKEGFSLSFALGSLFIFAGILLALRIKPDTTHIDRVGMPLKLALAATGALLFGLGMFAEKQAINHMGVWAYAEIGWTMQAVGAIALFVMFGQNEKKHINRVMLRKSILLGTLTSLAGVSYIYALSKGSLSHTIVATSGRAGIVLALAALFLNERNAMRYRLTACGSAILGIVLILA